VTGYYQSQQQGQDDAVIERKLTLYM